MPISATSVLHAAIRDIVDAAKSPHALERIETVLRDLTDRFHSLGALVHEEDEDEAEDDHGRAEEAALLGLGQEITRARG